MAATPEPRYTVEPFDPDQDIAPEGDPDQDCDGAPRLDQPLFDGEYEAEFARLTGEADGGA